MILPSTGANTKVHLLSIVIPVFRDADQAINLVAALQRQRPPPDTSIEIIIVDDGSGDGSASLIEKGTKGSAHLLRLGSNSGRAVARNAGAAAANGQVLVFLDCDCLPDCTNFLNAHLDILRQGFVATCGRVTGCGGGFWERYQHDASMRRERLHAQGDTCFGSSQNLAVVKSAFDQLGGFNKQYSKYGFEDRDLLLRLSVLGPIGWCKAATVRHLDRLALSLVLDKMRQAGELSAELFAQDHPYAYRKLGYAAIDSRLHSWLHPIGRTLGPIVLRGASAIEPLLHNRWMPYPLAKYIVKILSALAFLYGTTLSKKVTL